ncbi:9346_t:CDS:2, partial [Dentiscutata erythropus]
MDMTLQEQVYETRNISSLAYMDDTVWITQNKQQMQEILEIVQEFFDINKITVNASKSELILVNGHKEDHKNGIDFMENKIIPKKPSEAVRYLGIWIQENGKKTYQKSLIKEKVFRTTSIMNRKQLTDKQSCYILNHVLFPQIEYLMQDLIYSEKDLEKLNAKIRSCFRRSCGHSAKLPTSILYSPLGYKLFNLQNRQLQIMKLLAVNNIEIQINNELEFPVLIRGGNLDIESFMNSDIWYHKHRDSLKKYG